jgi:hypothetical protein
MLSSSPKSVFIYTASSQVFEEKMMNLQLYPKVTAIIFRKHKLFRYKIQDN